jgi:hypothetical protein
VICKDWYFPPFLGYQRTSAMISMMVCDDNRIQIRWRHVEHVESLFELNATEPLINKDMGRARAEKRGVATTARPEVRD